MKSQKTIFIFFIFLLFNVSLISAGLLYNNPNLPSMNIIIDSYNFGQCSASNYVYGITDDGTLLCRADLVNGSGGGGDAGLWNSTFNTTFDSRDKNTQLSEVTVDGYADNNGYLTSYTETDPNLWNASFNSTGDARWLGGSGDNASFNKTYTDTLYLPHTIIWDNTFNSSFDARDQQGSGNASWNKSYADTLYSTGSHTTIWDDTFNTTFTNLDSDTIITIWDITFNNSFDNRDKDTITTIWDASFNSTGDSKWSGGSGDNASWNQSHANTLYSGIEWDYNQTTATYNLYNAIWLSTINKTSDNFNKTYTDTLYSGIEWDYNQTTATYNLYNSDWLSTINKTSDNFNKTYTDTLYSVGLHTVIWDATFNTSFDARDKDTDTNESTRFATLVATDCTGSDKVTGVDTSGALICEADATGEGAVGNPFNQVLNLTSNVTFARINATDWSNISITESQISDLTHTVIWDATFNTSFANLDSDTITTIWDTDFNTSFDARDNDTITTIWDATFNTSFDARDKDTITVIWDATFNTSFDNRDTNSQLSEDNVEAFIFDNDNTDNLNMSSYNVTSVDCIIFKSGGKICTA